MTIRKTAEQIKEEILFQLNKQPLSVEQLRINIEDSNWATINKYLEKLKEDGLVREVISTGKMKIYQKIISDTYFDLPITEEQRKKFHTLFSMIFNEYKKYKKTPTKTHIAKCAVHVIDDKEAGLSDLPIVWYLYGMMPLMAIDLNMNYIEECALERKKKIENLIVEFVDKHGEKKSSQIKKEQHKKYNEETYKLSDEIFDLLNEKEINNKKVTGLLNRFFVACPVDSEFPEVFDLTEKVISLIQKMDLIEMSIQDYRRKVLLTFDALWRFIALYKLYKSRTSGANSMQKEAVKNFYLGGALEEKKRILQESLSDLNSEYLSKLGKFDVNKIELPAEVKEIKKIMEDWTGED